MVDFYEHENKPSVTIRGGKSLNQLIERQFIQKDSVLC
jgi:hypothetical protein